MVNDQLLLELGTSAIKPKQNEGSERLAVAEEVFDFVLYLLLIFRQSPHIPLTFFDKIRIANLLQYSGNHFLTDVTETKRLDKRCGDE